MNIFANPFVRRFLMAMFFSSATASIAAEHVVLVAGGGTEKTGIATHCRLTAPFGVDFTSNGELVMVEMEHGERVLKIDRAGNLIVLGGSGEKGSTGDGGPARQAQFNGMHSLVIGPNDDIYVADTWNNRIRKIEAKTGVVTAFAGTGAKGFSGDGGPALAAQFGGVYSVAFDSSRENLYLADLDNRRVRAINLKSGIVKTVAGNGEKGIPADGADAVNAPLVDPRAAVVDSKNNLYILERSGHALRKVIRNGKIFTVAGTGKKGAEGDGGPALKATLSGPKHLCVDARDNIIIADTDNHLVRKYIPGENIIVRIAGSGKRGSAGIGGAPDALELDQPHGVQTDRNGILYIVDSLNNRVLKITP